MASFSLLILALCFSSPLSFYLHISCFHLSLSFCLPFSQSPSLRRHRPPFVSPKTLSTPQGSEVFRLTVTKQSTTPQRVFKPVRVCMCVQNTIARDQFNPQFDGPLNYSWCLFLSDSNKGNGNVFSNTQFSLFSPPVLRRETGVYDAICQPHHPFRLHYPPPPPPPACPPPSLSAAPPFGFRNINLLCWPGVAKK